MTSNERFLNLYKMLVGFEKTQQQIDSLYETVEDENENKALKERSIINKECYVLVEKIIDQLRE